MLHFLATISDDSWTGRVGSLILLTFGPESLGTLQHCLRQLQDLPQVKSFDMEPAALVDFSVRQVWPTDQNTDQNTDLDALADFFEEVSDHNDPVEVPERLVAGILALVEADDPLKISRLPLFQSGALECGVCLPDRFGGRNFFIAGSVSLEWLAYEA